MFLDCLLIVVGVALVLWGADRLTEGAAALARRMNVPEIVIGLTIVAAGTSAPELFVSVVSALNDTPDLAVGNVVGSNIMNAMLIVGVTAMVTPMTIAKSTVRKDMPFAIVASAILIILCLDSLNRWKGFAVLDISGSTISRIDGIILLAVFAFFMIYTLRIALRQSPVGVNGTAGGQSQSVTTGGDSQKAAEGKSPSHWKSLFFIVLGLTCLIVGSNLFVDSATSVAESLGVSQGIIGLTVVAGGTSLPELATSVVAARKGQSALAIGNVIGSNVFNILLILGLTSVICPMQIEGITIIDLAVMLLSMLLLWFFSFTKFTVEKWEGAVLSIGYLAYTAWLMYNI